MNGPSDDLTVLPWDNPPLSKMIFLSKHAAAPICRILPYLVRDSQSHHMVHHRNGIVCHMTCGIFELY